MNIGSKSTGCPAASEIPIHTEYKLFDGSLKTNLISVERSFDFGAGPYEHAFRPFIPRLFPLDGYTQVFHPDAAGAVLISETLDACDFGCQVDDWDGSWFAIHNPTTGQGMIVMHTPSPYETALWIDMDGGSFTNSSAVLLLPPPGGFTGMVTETQYLYFYDSGSWVPALMVPLELAPGTLSLEAEHRVSMPLNQEGELICDLRFLIAECFVSVVRKRLNR